MSNIACVVSRLGMPRLVVSQVVSLVSPNLNTACHKRWLGTVALVRVGQLHVTLVPSRLHEAIGCLWE